MVTSTGTSPRSAVVWVVRAASVKGSAGTLDAFAAVPSARCARPCVMRPIWARTTIGIANVGDLPATVTVTSPPAAPFTAAYRVPAGLPLGPGYELKIPVTFVPARAGTITGLYRLTWTDLLGKHTVRVRLTGTGVG